MANPEPSNILRRMTRATAEDRDVRGVSPARALRVALARTAAQLWDLPLSVTAVRKQLVDHGEVTGALRSDALMVLLDGPEGARGGMALDRALVASLIEVQTIGSVLRVDLSEREPTPTDAAMIAPWLDEALERSDVALGQDANDEGMSNRWAIGYRFGALAEDARALALVLDATEFHLLRLQIDVADGARSGEMTLVLPAEKTYDPVTDEDPPENNAQSFLSVPAEITVFAARKTLTLSEASKLAPGDVLPIDELLLKAAELRAVDGNLLGTARLGQLNGHWAIKLEGEAPASTTAVPEGTSADMSQKGDFERYDLPEGTTSAMDMSDVSAMPSVALTEPIQIGQGTDAFMDPGTGLPPDLPPPSSGVVPVE